MRFFYSVAILLLAGHTISFSQTVTIRGQVKTDHDSALVGASVLIKGRSIATVTNQHGEFSISAPSLPATLVISAVGFKIKELVVKQKDSTKYLSINLYASEVSLDEVVVVGFGTAKRKDLTGLSTTIEGRVAGLTASKTSRATGSHVKAAVEKRADDTKPAYAGRGRQAGGRSKVLTAGELSDFKKWQLWEGYTKAEFKQWSDHWGIAPVNRYCLQVQNEDRKAIAGEKVYLLNLNTNDTVWRTVTDNTGKAELWANIDATDNNQNTYAIICGNETRRHPTSFENGINRITLNKKCVQSSIANIAFVVDATGSMGDEIQYLQEELQDVIANISAKNKGIDLRVGSVFYRDHTDSYVTRPINFQSDPSALIQFIKNQSADGGGDFPEAVDDALIVALDELHWDKTARAKIIFLILDAPPHEKAKEKMKKLMMQAASMGVRIVPVVCSGIDKSTEYLMRSIALTTNGSYVFLTDDSGVGGKHIKPTTDMFKVELLNDLLQRVIAEMIYMAPCDEKEKPAEPENHHNNIVKVVVYPNPSAGRIEIRSSEKIKEMYIADFAGKLLQRVGSIGKSRNWAADLSNYPSGTYLVRYFSEENGWGAEKVLLVK
jgi:hypothetical protein